MSQHLVINQSNTPVVSDKLVKTIGIIILSTFIVSLSSIVLFFIMKNSMQFMLTVGSTVSMITAFALLALYVFRHLMNQEPIQYSHIVPLSIFVVIVWSACLYFMINVNQFCNSGTETYDPSQRKCVDPKDACESVELETHGPIHTNNHTPITLSTTSTNKVLPNTYYSGSLELTYQGLTCRNAYSFYIMMNGTTVYSLKARTLEPLEPGTDSKTNTITFDDDPIQLTSPMTDVKTVQLGVVTSGANEEVMEITHVKLFLVCRDKPPKNSNKGWQPNAKNICVNAICTWDKGFCYPNEQNCIENAPDGPCGSFNPGNDPNSYYMTTISDILPININVPATKPNINNQTKSIQVSISSKSEIPAGHYDIILGLSCTSTITGQDSNIHVNILNKNQPILPQVAIFKSVSTFSECDIQTFKNLFVENTNKIDLKFSVFLNDKPHSFSIHQIRLTLRKPTTTTDSLFF